MKEVRDIADELGMIGHVQQRQQRILEPLESLQRLDVMSRAGVVDSEGNCLGVLTECEQRSLDWDPKGWFQRLVGCMSNHRKEMVDMLEETDRVYAAVCSSD